MSSGPERILVFLPNWLGDVVMATPVLRALAARFPHAAIDVTGLRPACDMVRGLGYVQGMHAIEDRRGLMSTFATGGLLRQHDYDVAVVLPHSFRAALIARISGARQRIGQDRSGRAKLLTEIVPPHRENGNIAPEYMTREYLRVVRPLGCADDGRGPELVADELPIDIVRSRIEGDGPVVGIAPGAAFGPSKRWLPDRYAQVADRLREECGARRVLITGPGEEDTRDSVQQAAKCALIECDDGHPTIDTLKATVSQLDLLVCNDSGPRHVAVAFGVPTVCIMGPTKPAYSCGPYEKGEVLRVEVDCGPCQKSYCSTDHRCMTRIGVDEVVAAAKRALARRYVSASVWSPGSGSRT